MKCPICENHISAVCEDDWLQETCKNNKLSSEVNLLKKRVKAAESFISVIKETHEFNERNTKECKNTKYEDNACSDNYSRIRNNIICELQDYATKLLNQK